MDRRLNLHQILKNILGSDEVYFQPPSSTYLSYPCIIYERSGIDTKKADNFNYIKIVKYTITLIGSNPESSIINDILDIPTCVYDRFYTYNGLNHDVFSLYY